MANQRSGRRKYYDIFSHFYDGFIRLHSRNDNAETRAFLVDSAGLEGQKSPGVLDVCCGTGSVILAFAERFAEIVPVGCDFSRGMLRRAQEKDASGRLILVEGDAAALPFESDLFDAVCCSHALYELKGRAREAALFEMRRVVKPGGRVLIMEHEVPAKLWVRVLFHIRMRMVGSKEASAFLRQGRAAFEKIFAEVSLSHTPSGKSRLFTCRK